MSYSYIVGVRTDSHIYSDYEISPHYDSLVAKIVAHGKDRPEAMARLRRALGEVMIDGPATTIPLGQAILADERFIRGEYNTAYLEHFLNEGFVT